MVASPCGFDVHSSHSGLRPGSQAAQFAPLESAVQWLSAFTASRNKRHDHFWSISITPKRNPIAPHFPQPSPAPGKSHSTYSKDWPVLDIPCKCNHVCGLL